MEKRLYRVRKGRILAGVAAGMAEYFDVDPTVMRLIFVAVSLAYIPLGVVGYIIAALVVPERMESGVRAAGDSGGAGEPGENDDAGGQVQVGGQPVHSCRGKSTRYLLGAALLIMGMALLLRRMFPWFLSRYFWPVLLIAAGLIIIFRGWRR